MAALHRVLWAQVWDSAAAKVRHTYAHGCVQALCLRCSYSAAANPPATPSVHTHTAAWVHTRCSNPGARAHTHRNHRLCDCGGLRPLLAGVWGCVFCWQCAAAIRTSVVASGLCTFCARSRVYACVVYLSVRMCVCCCCCFCLWHGRSVRRHTQPTYFVLVVRQRRQGVRGL